MTPLRQRMINDMTVRGLARSTMASYLRSVTRLARHYRRSPDQISAREVQDFLVFLQQHEGLHRATCNTIRHGVRFFYRITLERPDPHFYLPGAKQASRLPQLLNHEELVRLFTVTTDLRHRAVLMTAYAAGLRASELGRLRLSASRGASAMLSMRPESAGSPSMRPSSNAASPASAQRRPSKKRCPLTRPRQRVPASGGASAGAPKESPAFAATTRSGRTPTGATVHQP